MNTDFEFRESSYFENLREHVFISELIQEAWVGRRRLIDILRSEVDSSGYDLVLDCGGIIRHVQLKSSRLGAKTARQTVNVKLAEKPSGCVVWLLAGEDAQRSRVTLRYLFFGDAPGEPLPSIAHFPAGRHTKGDASGRKAERPNTRVIPKANFREIDTTADLFTALFGP